jgi:uncharacterized protein DUF4352
LSEPAGHRRRYLLLASGLGAILILAALAFWPHPAPPSSAHPGPTPTVPPKVSVAYSTSYPSTIAGLQPSSGNEFLMVSLTVENKGYQNFTADPFKAMYVIVSGQSYNVSAAYAFLSNPFPPSIDLKNGERASGDVVFEVPIGSTSFVPEWRLPSGIQLDWVSS